MKAMAKALLLLILAAGIFAGGYFLGTRRVGEASPVSVGEVIRETPYDKYSIESMGKAYKEGGFAKPLLEIGDLIEESEDGYKSYYFTLSFNANLDGKTYKKTTGQINIPDGAGKFPLIVMFRGYVDQTIYKTGIGTKPAASFFAKNGYITVAPDFLGYAGSDSEAANIFESRFQTYVTAVSMLDSINQIKAFDGTHVYIWAHSNGGQIALTTLEVTESMAPTVLWAPVSKPFPYSVLYYTDESADHGKLIRSELAKFETDYNVEKYSLTNYFDAIKAPVELHQGTADDAVPLDWTNALNANLKKAGVSVDYFTYPGADHNLRPSWDSVVERNLQFYKSSSGTIENI